MPRLPDLDIVIVNWNAGRQLEGCLASLVASRGDAPPLRRVVVVDNASREFDEAALRTFPLPLQVIRNRENLGFAAACNLGAAESEAGLLLFLNPDTALSADSLAVPAAFMARPENSRIGIVGIRLHDSRGVVSRSCARFPTPLMFLWKMLGLHRVAPAVFRSYPMEEWDHGASAEVDHVMGAFYLVRRSLFRELGGFDERFFVYLEDLDFSLRAAARGWKSYFLTSAGVYHRGGGTSERARTMRLFYALRSQILYCRKHFPPAPAFALTLATVAVEPVVRLVFALATLSRRRLAETVGGSLLLWSALPAILKAGREPS